MVPRENIFEKEVLVFPINIASSHWILVVVFQPGLMDRFEHILDNDKRYFFNHRSFILNC